MIRAYGVEDDPKQPLENATWFNRPILETLERLGLRSEELWGAEEAPTLWNAALFPVTTPDEAWACARWMMGYASGYGAGAIGAQRSASRWPQAQPAPTARLWPKPAIAACRASGRRRLSSWPSRAQTCGRCWPTCPAWRRPPLPGVPCGCMRKNLRLGSAENLTHAASHLLQAARLLDRAGFEQEAAQAEAEAFTCIQDAVRAGTAGEPESGRLHAGASIVFMSPRRPASTWEAAGPTRRRSASTGAARCSTARWRLTEPIPSRRRFGAFPSL